MAIVLAADSQATILPAIERLKQLDDALEIILVLPSSEARGAEELGSAARIRVVEVESVFPLAAARAAGIRAAASSLVFIGETHAFPLRGMFETLIAAHESGCTAAVPAFENANPDGAVSWAGFLTGYASWTAGIPPQDLAKAPTVNVSYRRSFLVGLGRDLEYALSSGGDMGARLRKAGHRIRFEPAARIEHANNSFLAPWMSQRFVAGRVIGGTRSVAWTRSRRLAHAITSPVIPAVLIGRSRGGILRTIRLSRPPPGFLPLMILGSALQAAGEMVSYIAGSSASANARFDDFEIRLLAYTRIVRPKPLSTDATNNTGSLNGR